MSEPVAYEPTRVRRLYVRGYRSIQELTLADLPPVVVLHGENGAGKSNILRAMALPLRWLGSESTIAGTREASGRVDYLSADSKLGIRRDDFHRAAGHEIQIQLDVDLGTRARQSVGGLEGPASLEIDVHLQDVGDGFRWWASRAQVGDLSLTGDEAQQAAALRAAIQQQEAALGQAQAELHNLREQLRNPSIVGAQRVGVQGQITSVEIRANNARAQIDSWESQLRGNALLMDRLRSKLLRRDLVRVSEAYRRISREPMGSGSEFDVDSGSLVSPEQIQRRLYLLATSSDTRERAMPRLLATRLAAATGGLPIELSAVRNNEFREYETQWRRCGVEGIPIANLGTGEQQLLILLLDVLMSGSPIVQLEEPEAHLHKKLMLRLAEVLHRTVAEHDVDQLFIATHHHAFAMAPRYYEVTCDDERGTKVTPKDRAKAIAHFYEPGPLWDALRSLVDAGLSENAALFRDEDGAVVHAKDVLSSIQEEGPLAKKFADEMTKTMILAMREEAERNEP